MTLKIGIFLALFKKATTTCAFLRSSGQLASLGSQPDGLPSPETKEGWSMLQDRNGTRAITKPQRKLLLGLLKICRRRSLKEYDDHHDSVATASPLLRSQAVIAGGGGGWLDSPFDLSTSPINRCNSSAAPRTRTHSHRLYSRHRRICPDVDNLSNEEMQEQGDRQTID